MKKIAIVGAGPAGVYAALNLQEFLPDIQIDIFEKTSPLKTLLPTGGGRCNLTHEAIDVKSFAKNYPRGEKFLYSVFSRHFVQDTLLNFKKFEIDTYCDKNGRYFPKSDSSSKMRKILLEKLKAKVIIKEIKNLDELKHYSAIVISTGTHSGTALAKEAGHNIVPLKPSLTGLTLDNNSPKFPEGVQFSTPNGNVLFTKNGITGPAVYEISSINAHKNFPYTIDFPFIDVEELKNEVLNNPKKAFGNVVSKFIPNSLAKCVVKNYNTQSANIKKSEIENLKTITFGVISPDNKGEIVMAGGVELNELTNFCRSKINDKIWFCGEIINADGFCGGFNLQLCWSSAYCAALDIKKFIKN